MPGGTPQTNRKRKAPPSRVAPKRKRRARKQSQTKEVWRPQDWIPVRRLLEGIDVLRNKTTPSRLIVQKVLRNADTSSGQQRHFEIQALEMLPPCNRIVQMLDCVHRYPDPDHCAAFFEYYPLGDVFHWKEAMFDKKNHKPVPESYIWRFFIQMAQALLFIQGGSGPDQDRREPIVHRDIKPKNVLVVDNGSTYPSFKLHDFGCATIRKPGKQYKESYCGTFEWQPPENPRINTEAAEVWSLGACVHFLATGRAPTESVMAFEQEIRRGLEGRQHPESAEEYEPNERYYAARVPRRVMPINLSAEEQMARGTPRYNGRFNHQYSSQLNSWMSRTLSLKPMKRPTAAQLSTKMATEARKMLRQMTGRAGLFDLDVRFDGVN